MAIEETRVVLIPDRASFLRVDRALADLGRNASIDLGSRAINQVRDIESAVRGIPDIDLDADINIEAARAEIARIADDLDIKVDVDALTEGAQAELNRLERDGDITVEARAEIERALSELTSLERNREATVTAEARGIAGVERQLDGVASESRIAVIEARAEVAKARGDLDELTKDREMTVTSRVIETGRDAAGGIRGARSVLGGVAAAVGANFASDTQLAALARSSSLSNASRETGLDISFLDAFVRASSQQTGFDRDQIIDGLRDGFERFGEELNEKILAADEAARTGKPVSEGGPLGQLDPAARQALVDAESPEDRLNIFLRALQNATANGGDALALTREAFGGDEISTLILEISKQPDAFADRLARVFRTADLLTPERAAENRQTAIQIREAGQLREDALASAATSETGQNISRFLAELQQSISDTIRGAGSESDLKRGIGQLEREVDRRDGDVPQSIINELNEARRLLVQIQAQNIRTEIEEASSAIQRVDNPTTGDRARALVGDGRDFRVDRAQGELDDVRDALEASRLNGEELKAIRELIGELVSVSRDNQLTMDRNDFTLGRAGGR